MRPRLAFAMAAARTRHVLDAATLAWLAEHCEILSPAPLEDFSSPAALRILSEVEILVTGWGSPAISPTVVAAAPRLRLIAHAAGSVKAHVDPAVFDAGIAVTNAANANAVPVAEYTLAMIILANKQVFAFRDRYRADPSRGTSDLLADAPIGNYRRTIGIVGASRIGRRVIELLAALDCSILLCDPHVRPDDVVCRVAELSSLEQLVAASDVVSLHAPSLPATRHMIGRRELRLMRDGATLINTARGALVDEAALLGELESGRINAVIDVTDPEIPVPESPFFRLPNVFLTPHIAGAIGTERARLGQVVAEEVGRFIAGEALRHQVQFAQLEQLA